MRSQFAIGTLHPRLGGAFEEPQEPLEGFPLQSAHEELHLQGIIGELTVDCTLEVPWLLVC